MRVAAIFVTWFGIGWLPRAPGSWGSLAALPFAWAIEQIGGPGLLALAALALFALGCWGSDIALRATQSRAAEAGGSDGIRNRRPVRSANR